MEFKYQYGSLVEFVIETDDIIYTITGNVMMAEDGDDEPIYEIMAPNYKNGQGLHMYSGYKESALQPGVKGKQRIIKTKK